MHNGWLSKSWKFTVLGIGTALGHWIKMSYIYSLLHLDGDEEDMVPNFLEKSLLDSPVPGSSIGQGNYNTMYNRPLTNASTKLKSKASLGLQT